MDETVVGAAPARWTTAGMERGDGMQGSWSEAVDERGRSLVMDGDIGVSPPARWRRTAVDGVVDGGGRRKMGWRGCFGAHRVRMGKMEVERKGGTMSSGRACLKCEEIYKLSPRFKFPTSQQYLSVGDRTVISHRIFANESLFFGAHRV